MTVSPNQPQDGSIPTPRSAIGNRRDAPHSSEPLPPTFFSLPNLRAETAKVPTVNQAISNPNPHAMESKCDACPLSRFRFSRQSWDRHSQSRDRRHRRSFATINRPYANRCRLIGRTWTRFRTSPTRPRLLTRPIAPRCLIESGRTRSCWSCC